MMNLNNILISILTIFKIAAAIYGFGMMIFEGGLGLNLVFANNKNSKSDNFWKIVCRRYYCSGKSKKIFLAAICVILSLFVLFIIQEFCSKYIY